VSTQPSRRQRQPRLPIEVRREQVLDAALKLISEGGYGGVTMDAIAREANIAKPVVYNAYAGRAALLHALLEREERRGLGALAEAMPPQPVDADPAETFITWLRSLAETIASSPDTWRLILLPPDGTPEEVRDRVQAGRDFALAQAQALATSLLEGRRGSAEIDPEMLGHSLFAVCEHGARLMLTEPDRFPPERMVQFARDLLDALGLR
jgi:AcrR family transcriptional regulator